MYRNRQFHQFRIVTALIGVSLLSAVAIADEGLVQVRLDLEERIRGQLTEAARRFDETAFITVSVTLESFKPDYHMPMTPYRIKSLPSRDEQGNPQVRHVKVRLLTESGEFPMKGLVLLREITADYASSFDVERDRIEVPPERMPASGPDASEGEKSRQEKNEGFSLYSIRWELLFLMGATALLLILFRMLNTADQFQKKLGKSLDKLSDAVRTSGGRGGGGSSGSSGGARTMQPYEPPAARSRPSPAARPASSRATPAPAVKTELTQQEKPEPEMPALALPPDDESGEAV